MRPPSVFESAGAVLLGMLVLACACAPAARHEPASPTHVRASRSIRIGLATGAATLAVRARGEWEAQADGERRALHDGSSLRFAVFGDRILLTFEDGSELQDGRNVRLEPRADPAMLEYGGVPYSGRFSVRLSEGGLVLIDALDLEEYLRGVVTWEIGELGPEASAAVEAQAVTARTYTLSRLGQFESEGFDLFGDERDQVFKGALRRDAVADRAIDKTRGMVLENGGRLAQAYYSSTCGGYTSWIEHVWPKPAQPYLRGQRDAGADGRSYCASSKHFRWTEAWSGADLESTLQQTLPRVLQLPPGTAIGGLTDLRVAERDASARVLALEIQTTTGTYTVRGDSIRWALRPRDRALLRSLMFELEVERSHGAIVRVVARGGGNGHGVGMCQMGAVGMAEAGSDAGAILAHYYPGTHLQRLY